VNRLTLYALAALAVLAAASLAYAAHERHAAAAARFVAEAAQLDAAGVARAREASERQLRAELDAAKTEVRGFAGALARAERAARSRPMTVARSSTGPLPVEAEPAPIASPGPGGEAECALRAGDRGKIDVATAELTTEAGNRVLVQAAQASRVDADGTSRVLFGGELRTDLTRYLSSEVGPPPRGRVGLGALGLCTGSGCSAGLLVAAPPVFGGRVEFYGGAFAGGAGRGLLGGVLIRF
jgi:hypothetical protein